MTPHRPREIERLDSLIIWTLFLVWVLCVVNIANQIRHQNDGGAARPAVEETHHEPR